MKLPKSAIVGVLVLGVMGFAGAQLLNPQSENNSPTVTQTPAPTKSPSPTGTGMFGSLGITVSLDVDTDESVDVQTKTVQSQWADKGCFAELEIIYLGPGGDDQTMGELIRCTKDIWETSINPNEPKGNGDLVLDNATDVVIYFAPASVPFESGSPMARDFVAVREVFLNPNNYSYQ
ncbi:MAG: hypothetical protein RLZZ426_477 [Actinomycetota bacterium]